MGRGKEQMEETLNSQGSYKDVRKFELTKDLMANFHKWRTHKKSGRLLETCLVFIIIQQVVKKMKSDTKL